MHYLPRIIELSAILIVVHFHRLKINHDSHEFILEYIGEQYAIDSTGLSKRRRSEE
jgi:hypothetical protein